MKEVLGYFLKLIVGIALVFGAHLLVLYLLNQPLFENQIVFSYVVNTVVALAILLALLKAPKSLQNSLGFLFLGGSLLKFLVFFAIIYPVYKADGNMDKWEFSTFFIPYIANLVLETKALTNKLSQ